MEAATGMPCEYYQPQKNLTTAFLCWAYVLSVKRLTCVKYSDTDCSWNDGMPLARAQAARQAAGTATAKGFTCLYPSC